MLEQINLDLTRHDLGLLLGFLPEDIRHARYVAYEKLRDILFTWRADEKDQYEDLWDLFSNSNDPIIALLNQRLSSGLPWNWLLENLQWTFTHGPKPAIPRPWPVGRDNRHYEIYPEAYAIIRGNEISEKVIHSQAWQKLSQYPAWYQDVITYGPVILAFGGLIYGSTIAAYGFLALCLGSGSIYGYAFFESFLDNIARLSELKKLPEWSHEIQNPGMKAYFQQVIWPFWRILSSRVDPYYAGAPELFLQLGYPLRIALGAALAAAATVSFIGDPIAVKSAAQITNVYLKAATLPGDIYDACSNLGRTLRFSTPASATYTSAPQDEINSTPRTPTL